MRAPATALARKRGRIEAVQAAALDADGWSRLFDDPVLGPLLLPIGLLGGDDGQLGPGNAEQLAQAEHRDELSRRIPDAVLALAGRVR
jgi:hypothetical protein